MDWGGQHAGMADVGQTLIETEVGQSGIVGQHDRNLQDNSTSAIFLPCNCVFQRFAEISV